MKQLISIILFIFFVPLCYSDSLYDNIGEQTISQVETNGMKLDSSYSVNKVFANFSQVTTKLNQIGIKTQVNSSAENEPANLLLRSNSTVKDFINSAADKFGYTWSSSNGQIIFTAINPKKIKPVAINKNNFTASSKSLVVKEQVWTLDPKDKTLRNAIIKWVKKVNWQLVWNVKADYPITTIWNISGSFESAINQVLQASQNTDVPLVATMHDNNHVLEVYSPNTVR